LSEPSLDRPTTAGPQGRGESEVNFTSRRQAWQDAHLDGTTRSLLAEDARYFLRQSVSTPCLSAIRRAEGIWIEDATGRLYMDFHGNSVHHIGYGHPRLIAALKRQLDDLPFAPRRFTCEPAIELARKLVEISPPGLDKVLFATGGGTPFMAPASARPASAARRCFAPVPSGRCCREPSMSPRSPAIAAPTAMNATLRASRAWTSAA
jgi:hypothetical protein